ncbi:hypothetical protein HanIR_Chr07g0314141 [Helianthus annuus]|nr:hypothetical protein HanIR_Chr07g0314141 [Helianthus annuus]
MVDVVGKNDRKRSSGRRRPLMGLNDVVLSCVRCKKIEDCMSV